MIRNKEDLSIIIINYNTFQLTVDCIKSVIEHTTKLTYEIILVDNGSTECLPEKFTQLFPELKLIEAKENLGFGRANNLGMSKALGKYILLLNSDTLITENSFKVCIDEIELECKKGREIDLVGCRIIGADKVPQPAFWANFNEDTHLGYVFEKGVMYNFLFQKLRSLFPKSPHPNTAVKSGDLVAGLYGAFILMNRKVFDETKGFDPDFFMYCEETDWFRKRIEGHYNILYTDKTTIIHLGGGSSDKEPSDFALTQNTGSYFLYWYKLSKFHYAAFSVITYLSIVCNLLFYPILSPRSRKIIHIHFNLIKDVFYNIPKHSNKYGARKHMYKTIIK